MTPRKMASATNLQSIMSHIQTMESAMVSILMEAIMKQSALIDATILIVVDGPDGRKWAGRNRLRDAYLDGALTPVENEREMIVDDVVNCDSTTPETNSIDDRLVHGPSFSDGATDPRVEKDDVHPTVHASTHVTTFSTNPNRDEFPDVKIRDDNGLTAEDKSMEIYHLTLNSPRGNRKRRPSPFTNHVDVPPKRRSLQEEFQSETFTDGFILNDDESDGREDVAVVNDGEANAAWASDASRSSGGHEDVFQIPPTSEFSFQRSRDAAAQDSLQTAVSDTGYSTELGRDGVKSKLPKRKSATSKGKDRSSMIIIHDDYQVMDEVTALAARHSISSAPGGLTPLDEMLSFLSTIVVANSPLVEPGTDSLSLAVKPYTWNRIFFATLEQWSRVLRVMRTMSPAHLFANRSSLLYKIFSSVMRQFSRAVAQECPYMEEKGENVNRFLGENFDKFLDTFPNCRNQEFNYVIDGVYVDPRLKRGTSSFRGISRKEVQKHYNEHLRAKLAGKFKNCVHVMIPLEKFCRAEEEEDGEEEEAQRIRNGEGLEAINCEVEDCEDQPVIVKDEH